ncbi:hypothetical protein [Phreatobacter sp.]|uniref:hypothetical protein n=1 Tax=Phreatobacter sp. TaxID=1966341 RepID=UPI003F6FDCB0
MRDLASNLGLAASIVPAVQSDTVTGDPVDLAGFDGAMVVIPTGAIAGSGNFTAKVQESDTTTSGDFTDVVAKDRVGDLPASLAASAVVKQGYIGAKRYVRVVLTKNSGTSIAAGAVVVRGQPAQKPVA